MSSVVLFEYPLNEKMRTWLRIEYLLQQLTGSMPVSSPVSALSFFGASLTYWISSTAEICGQIW